MNLKSLFFNAFALRPRPPATRIIRPTVSSEESNRLRDLLAAKTPMELSVAEIRREIEGNLWMLTPEAFRHFLPAFLHVSLEFYESVSVFVSELVGSLTQPTRSDVVEAFDRAARLPPRLGLPDDMIELLREQQLEWFDSGTPIAIFHERVDSLTPVEGAAILAFFIALQDARGADFPFGELETSINRHWYRYRNS